MTTATVIFSIIVMPVAIGMLYANKRGAEWRPEYDHIA